METSLPVNRVFIGYDARQALTYNVLQHSIVIRAKSPVSITPLIIEQLPIERRGLTPFTFTRFLVPWLCNYEGWALFMDADMLCRGDITELFDLAEEDKAVMVVKGDHRFEWASLILFNCGHPDNQILTPEYVEEAKNLHAIGWTENVGSLPREWNVIVFYDDYRDDAKVVHYTAGIPAHPEVRGCDYESDWFEDAQFMCSSQPWEVLMGNSVHVPKVREHNAKKVAEPTGDTGEGRFAGLG